MAIENLKKRMIFALSICNIAFWLYIAPKNDRHCHWVGGWVGGRAIWDNVSCLTIL